MGADAARRSVVLLDAMAGRQAGEVVPFHRPSSATPFAGADDVYRLDVLEHVGGGKDGADLGLRRLGQAELANKALRLAVGLGREADSRRCPGLPALGTQPG